MIKRISPKRECSRIVDSVTEIVHKLINLQPHRK